MPPALTMTPCTRVRCQCSTHHRVSWRPGAASTSRMLVWPQRMTRRYQGSGPAPAGAAPFLLVLLVEARLVVARVVVLAVMWGCRLRSA